MLLRRLSSSVQYHDTAMVVFMVVGHAALHPAAADMLTSTFTFTGMRTEPVYVATASHEALEVPLWFYWV